MMKSLFLLASILLLSLAAARGQTPAPSLAPEEKPPYQIRVSEKEAVEMYRTFVVGVYGDFAAQLREKLKAEPAAVAEHLALFINGVEMKGLNPVVLSSEAFRPSDETVPKADLALQFVLNRDSADAENRAAWDTLLPRLAFGEQGVQVGVSLDHGLAHLTGSNDLRFRVRPGWYISTVIVVGLVSFGLLMYLTVTWTNMLRESGPATPYSLGKSQMAFWGLLVAVAFLGVFTIGHKQERIPGPVLVLLGISSVTGLGAVLINKKAATDAAAGAVPPLPDYAAAREDFEARKARYKADKADIQKALVNLGRQRSSLLKQDLPEGAQPSLEEQLAALDARRDRAQKDLAGLGPTPKLGAGKRGYHFFTDITSDETGMSFHRLQAALWTVILGGVFVTTVCNTLSMPEFESTLLILMGISNGTYLGFKIPEKTA